MEREIVLELVSHLVVGIAEDLEVTAVNILCLSLVQVLDHEDIVEP